MQLRPFSASDATTVALWAHTHEEVEAWCGLNTFPAPPAVVVEWAQAPDVEAFVLCDLDVPVGYGEIWVDDDAVEVELAHIIVAPASRDRSIGRHLTQALTAVALTHHDVVFLRVLPANVVAQRCYARAGFERVSRTDEIAWNEGQPVEYVWMRAAQAIASA